MSEKVEKMFDKLTNNLDFDPSKYMVEELSSDQEKILKNAIEDTFKENIDGDIKKFGGKVNEEDFKKIEEEVEKRMKNPIFKPFEKDLEKVSKKWVELLKKSIEAFTYTNVPVKEMPFPSVTFLTVPRITWEKGKLDKMKLDTNGIAYLGEIKGLVTRTTLYGKMKKEDPLFAPHIGDLDLAGYKPDPNEKSPKSENLRFVYEIIKSMGRKATQNQVTRYDAQYERHGEPICDFLMKDEDLKKTLGKLTSAIESKRQTSSASITAMVLPLISTSMVIALDESSGNKKYETAFEALLKLAAISYETPNIKKGAALAQAQAAAMTQAANANTPSGMGVGGMVPQSGPAAPAAPQLPVWTESELAEEAKKRPAAASNLPVWTEEDLAEEAKKRGPAANLPVWTEEDLEKESARRHGAFNIPEWKEDDAMPSCPKCGYTCRPGWPDCPACGASLTEAVTSKPASTPATPSPPPSDEEKPEEKKTDEKPSE
jgi:hypothetical protein